MNKFLLQEEESVFFSDSSCDMGVDCVCLFCRYEGNFPRGRGGGTSWRGRGRVGRDSGPGYAPPPHGMHWPPQTRFYRPRHGQHPTPNQHHSPRWTHYAGVPPPPPHNFSSPACPRLPWDHQPAKPPPFDPPVPPAPAAWTPGGLLPPPPGSHILPSAGDRRPQLDTRYMQNSTLQHPANVRDSAPGWCKTTTSHSCLTVRTSTVWWNASLSVVFLHRTAIAQNH